MLLSAAALLANLAPGKTLDVRDEEGNCILSACPYEHLRYLAQECAITARGTSSGRPRYAVLEVPVAEAEKIVIEGARRTTPVRSGTITSGASRVVVNETIHGHKRTFKQWRFIRADAFYNSAGRLHTVASKAMVGTGA